jgi:hypothetical protein
MIAKIAGTADCQQWQSAFFVYAERFFWWSEK